MKQIAPEPPISSNDVIKIGYDHHALVVLARGTAIVIATLLIIPDGVSLIPSAGNWGQWVLRVSGDWISALILWFISFLVLSHLSGLLTGIIEVHRDGLRLWRLGRLIQWRDIEAVYLEPEFVFSKLFALNDVAHRLTIFSSRIKKGWILPHPIASFLFRPEDFNQLVHRICGGTFQLVPDSKWVLLSRPGSRPAISRLFRVMRWQRVIAGVVIGFGVVVFLARKAAVNFYYNDATRIFNAGNFNGARRRYQTALLIDPTFAIAWDHLARCELRLGNCKAATIDWERALALKPDLVESKVGLSYIYMGRGSLAQADLLLKRALKLAPNYVPALINLAQLNLCQGDREQARRLTIQAAAQPEQDAQSRALEAQLSLKLGNYQKAVELAREGLLMSPKNALARTVLKQAMHD